ncbi:MAG: hypothetical protein WBB67_07270 [bacterium]
MNELSYYFRCRRQDKRKLKEVLFNLLDIWHLMKANNPDLAVQITIDKLTGRFPDAFRNKEALLFLKPFYQDFADDLMQQIVSKEISGIKERYEISVNSLAKIDPLLAHRLSEKLSVQDYFKTFNERLNNVKNVFLDAGGSQDTMTFETIKAELKPLIMDDVVKTIEDDIKDVAYKIGIITWINTLQKLNKHYGYILTEANKKIDKFIENIIKKYQSTEQ